MNDLPVIVLLSVIACNMGIAFIIGYEEGKRRTKLKLQGSLPTKQSVAVFYQKVNEDGSWEAFPQGYQAP